jgi:hypothetical protein
MTSNPVRCTALLLALLLVPGLACAADPAPAAPAAGAAAPAADTKPAADAKKPAADAKAAAPAPADREAALTAALPQLAAPGEAVTLEAEGRKFFAFYRAGERKPPAVGLLVVPAIGSFIDQDAVIRELRTNVPRGGYATLAIQPPLPAPTADTAAYAALAAPLCARVKAGLAHLVAQGYKKAGLVAAGSAADALPGCFKDAWPPELLGFAVLGPWSGTLADLKLPVLDVVPAREAAAVKSAAARRHEARRAQPEKPYRQSVVEGAGRDYRGAEPTVAYAVRGWLKRLAEAVPPPPAKPAAGTANQAPAAKPGAIPVKG